MGRAKLRHVRGHHRGREVAAVEREGRNGRVCGGIDHTSAQDDGTGNVIAQGTNAKSNCPAG